MSNTDWSESFHDAEGLEPIRERVLADPDYIHARDKIGNTPLLCAIGGNDLELVRFLLDKGSDPNCEVDDGYTCLMVAVESGEEEADEEASLEILKTLIAAGADIHFCGINGWAPLHMAAARNQVEKAKVLLNAGADVNQRIQIDGHDSPLMEATRSGQAEMVKLLLEHGADTEVRDVILDLGLIELAETAMEGADPEVAEELRKLPPVNPEEMLAELDMDMPPEQIEMLKKTWSEMDMAQNYIDNANELAERGNFEEVIELLTNWQKK